MKKIYLHISNIIEQPNDVVTFEFTSDIPFSYTPGQFVSLEFTVNNKTLRRSYSLHSSPFVNEPLSISVKRVENGEISRKLQDLYKVGDKIEAYDPMGLFTYEVDSHLKRHLFLIGAGSGITPLFSILKSALIAEPQSKITLIYSNRSINTTLFYAELEALQQQYPEQLTIVYLWSNGKNLAMARLNRELLERMVTQHMSVPREDCLFYTCGPTDYMLMCRITLLTMGFTQEQLKKETFVLPEDEADDDDGTLHQEQNIDKSTYTVELEFEGTKHTIEIPYPMSILDAALQQHLDIPYSCKAGMCGSCSATCTDGSVNMRYNEVLTDRDVERGKILLCTSRPIGNGVKITL
ncbi:MAG: ferredoxin--NADP reductase [Bacteroidota bacterium]